MIIKKKIKKETTKIILIITNGIPFGGREKGELHVFDTFCQAFRLVSPPSCIFKRRLSINSIAR